MFRTEVEQIVDSRIGFDLFIFCELKPRIQSIKGTAT